jgi:hypothetical protein
MALEQGWYGQAREHFEQALTLDASNREAMKGLARANEMLSRKAAKAAERTKQEPPRRIGRQRRIEEKKREGWGRALTRWFKKRSRRGKVAILAGVPLLLICLCSGLADVISPTPEATLTPIPVRHEVEASPTPGISEATPTPLPPTATPMPTDTPMPTATPKPHAVVEELVREALGAGNRDVDRISKIKMASDGWVTVDWAIDDNLTEGMTKTGAKIDICDVAEALCQNGFCDGLTMHGSFSMQDVYGSVSELTVVGVVLRPETLARINWEHFDFHDIYFIADTVELHPAFED